MDIAKLNGQKVSRAVENLMPTPVASEGTKAPAQQTSEVKGKTGQVWLSNVAKDMEPTSPTPTASDWKGANNSGGPSTSANGLATKIDNLDTNWGKFEPAIRRWEETLGRPAPAPTKPDGKDGAHRLSSAFTEWMMGVPQGWITDCGLSRNEELKACGNGVVPQQAELALRVLLEGVALPAGGGQVNLPTPTVSDTYTDNLKSSQQKEGSMHSVTLPQAVRMVSNATN
jgi:DNA (cytosine-5)-methyltransferase 1